MTLIRAAEDADAASWLLASGVDWWDLVRYGPPGFPAYARIALPYEPEGAEPAYAPVDTVRAALSTLTGFTTTPGRGYAAIWEGWEGRDTAPNAPRLLIPHRTMLLFTGPIDLLRDAPAMAWHGSTDDGAAQEPHLVWPEDRTWCLACEVDEEIEFTVGCSEEAQGALEKTLPEAVRRVRYGDPTQTYRNNGT